MKRGVPNWKRTATWGEWVGFWLKGKEEEDDVDVEVEVPTISGGSHVMLEPHSLRIIEDTSQLNITIVISLLLPFNE